VIAREVGAIVAVDRPPRRALTRDRARRARHALGHRTRMATRT
jgi:hypothetical protein